MRVATKKSREFSAKRSSSNGYPEDNYRTPLSGKENPVTTNGFDSHSNAHAFLRQCKDDHFHTSNHRYSAIHSGQKEASDRRRNIPDNSDFVLNVPNIAVTQPEPARPIEDDGLLLLPRPIQSKESCSTFPNAQVGKSRTNSALCDPTDHSTFYNRLPAETEFDFSFGRLLDRMIFWLEDRSGPQDSPRSIGCPI